MPVGTPERHSIWQRRVAALLLVVQVSVGSAVTLAHAAETSGGPVRFEAHHTVQCVVLHDTARCAQCQFDATRMVAPTSRRPAWSGAAGRPVPSPFTAGIAPTRAQRGTAGRAAGVPANAAPAFAGSYPDRSAMS